MRVQNRDPRRSAAELACGKLDDVHPRAFRFLQELAHGEPLTLRIRGDCMEPLLQRDAPIVVRSRRVYLPGDVVVFRTPAGDLAAHRVLGYRPGGALLTKGDHCIEHDAPVDRAMIVGAVDGLRLGMRDRVRAIAHMAGIVARRLVP